MKSTGYRGTQLSETKELKDGRNEVSETCHLHCEEVTSSRESSTGYRLAELIEILGWES